MKKLLTSFFAIALSFGVFAQKTVASCNNNTPGWGESLGTVSFASEKTWKIGDQTWSDAVHATSCNKTTFKGGKSRKFNSDCRSNPEYNGDLFSWCAVANFGEILCPNPWRVPTVQDFVTLDKALGGSGKNREDYGTPYLYLFDWGGALGGFCKSDGSPLTQTFWGNYWQQSDHADSFTFSLTPAYVHTQLRRYKDIGLTLRCVRDN
ncbi:MAG: fibrobacter succinogenes major paralogous domain-containing protein [Bacteroidales bacterium]|nr:fibrobacter succinogenes major paralogous domain-containing protein [Bacteroidales bacterium]